MILSTELTDCRVCATQLSIHQRLKGICNSVECRRKDVPYQTSIRDQEIRESVRNRVPAKWSVHSEVTLLPYNGMVLQPLEDTRRELFKAHLEKLLSEAFDRSLAGSAPLPETTASVNGTSPEDAQLPVLGSACGLCGGHCCNTGGTAAWLETATIERVLSQHPELVDAGRAQLAARYLSYLPAVTHASSCVFHTSQGCNLPRELRSNVCNQFICKGLAELISNLPNSASSSIVASISGTNIKRVALMTKTVPSVENDTEGE